MNASDYKVIIIDYKVITYKMGNFKLIDKLKSDYIPKDIPFCSR